jgi:hypothetical protein
MKKAISLASVIALTVGMSSYVQANDDDDDDDDDFVINASMTVRGDTQPSGSGDTILANCGASSGKQSATVRVSQEGGNSTAKFRVRNARPNTVYTVWLRMNGSGPGDENGLGGGTGGSPMTGGGATPLAPGYTLDGLLHYSPPFAGSANPTNGFTTDSKGNANWTAHLDFPIVGGAYPFQRASTAAVQALRDAGSTWPMERRPHPVANAADPDISAPFLFRVISHCTDGVGHGLSPGVREAWFQYP